MSLPVSLLLRPHQSNFFSNLKCSRHNMPAGEARPLWRLAARVTALTGSGQVRSFTP
jgi:hypothetical protein